MANFSLWATFGLCLLKLCLTETQFNVSCRYAGVFHVEKDGRYSLTRSEAVELCKALNSTLPTLEQMRRAHKLGFETCRYGFIVGHIVIPRINPYHLCAANHIGIYKLSSNTTGRYDAYCYNATETRDKACEPIERLDTSLLNNRSKIVIDNADGSRYNGDGTRHSGDSSTSGVDDENVGSGSTHDTTAMDTSIRRSPSTSYFENTTPVSQLPDHSSGGGEREFPPISTDHEFSTVPTDISLVPIADDFPEKGDGQQPTSTTPGPHRDDLEKATTQAQWNPFLHHWWWSNPGDKAQEPTQATRDVTSSGNGSDDEDSSEETAYPTAFPSWDMSVAEKEYSASTTPGPHRDDLEKATTQAQWHPFLHHWWWSNPGDKAQEPTQATRDVTSSGNGSDDEDSSEETAYPTAFPSWDMSVAEYSASTTVDSQRETLQEISTHHHWNPSYIDEEERYSSTDGRDIMIIIDSIIILSALVTSESEKHEGPTQHPLLHSVHPGWISQEQSPANTTGSTEQPEYTVPGENDIEKESSHTAMASDYGAKQNDSAQDPLLYPGWDEGDGYSARPTLMDRIISSRANDHEKKSSSTAAASPDGAHHEDPTQSPLPSDKEQGQGTAGVTHATNTSRDEVLHGLNPASRNEPDDESPLTGTITESTDVVSQEEATKEPLAPGTQPGSESGRATTTDGSHVNLIPGVFPDAEDHLNRLPVPAPTTAASPDGAHHEDPTQSPLPSDKEQGQGTAGVTHATNTSRDEVLHGLNPASRNEPDDESPLTGTSKNNGSYSFHSLCEMRHYFFCIQLLSLSFLSWGMQYSCGGLALQNALVGSGPWLKWEGVGIGSLCIELTAASIITVTAAASPDGAHHEDPTQSPLPSDKEQGQGTAGVTHATNTSRDEVLHGLNPASRNEPDDESPLTGTITESTDVVSQEEATKEPLAPGTQPGSESGQATTTDGSHVNLIPGVFPDAEDHLNRLPVPAPTRATSSIYGKKGSHMGDHGSTPFPGQTTTAVISQPRIARVPEWLIIVCALVALALILGICIAVNSRRRCGQKKKLVINNGKGAVEDRKTGGLNGEASKSQEMVHLVHKEQSNDRTGACDEFLTLDETQNHQELDMKSGV
ncbi:CD44 antigen [Rhea pennata]|uniref:CD44 antigen n=1 Tax=Rhea pennata TaxID=8795 RepID=UPI002E262364